METCVLCHKRVAPDECVVPCFCTPPGDCSPQFVPAEEWESVMGDLSDGFAHGSCYAARKRRKHD